VLVCPNFLSAQIREGSFSLTPQAGAHLFEKQQNLEPAFTGGIGAGFNLTKVFSIETTFNYIRTSDANSAMKEQGYMLREDAVFHIAPDAKVVPYLASGLGWFWFGHPGNNHLTVAPNFGGGIKGFLAESVALRLDARRVMRLGPFRDGMMYTMGIDFLIGGRKKEAPAPRPTPTPAPTVAPAPPAPAPEPDTDGDGVVDSKDACPNTPQGVKVNSSGCPLDTDGDGVYDYLDKCPNTPQGVKVNSSGCPLDTDGDGVYDYLDKCPDTPSGVKVNSSGCPLDTDGDGVYDYLDKCPDTAKGLKVTADGCPILIKKSVTINLDIQFDTAKSVIKPEYNDKLKEVADFMKTYPQTTTVIEGHTDSVGAAKYNQALSQKRADSVKDYLVKNFGIGPDRIATKGYGKEKPIAPNNTAEGRTKNRRIQATFNAESDYYEKK
jgi:OOP family OmpA-OmpF porin